MILRRVPLDSLVEDDRNANQHDDRNRDAIRASLQEFGQVEPLVVQMGTGRVIGGNGRLGVMRDMGWGEADVVEVELDDHHATALALALNHTAKTSRWDAARLLELVGELEAEAPDLAAVTQFDERELDRTLAKAAAEEQRDAEQDARETPDEADDVPDVPATPTTQEGDVWRLGNHTLICGDCFLPEIRAKAFAARGADAIAHGLDLVVTDPPYAIYGSSTGIGADIADDKMVRPFFEQLFRMTREHLKTFGHAYFCTDWRSWAAMWEAARRAGLTAKNAIVWDKGNGGLGNNYANCYELIGFFAHLPPPTAMKSTTKKGQRPVHAPNIMRFPRVTGAERQHNAAKPVAMMSQLIENSSDAGDVVADFFAGSGSTLIAAEKTGRGCVAFEIEPKYCDVIVERWRRLTGGTPERV